MGGLGGLLVDLEGSGSCFEGNFLGSATENSCFAL